MSLNVLTVKAVFALSSKNKVLEFPFSETQCGGFQFLVILDLWGIRFHAVIVR